MRSGTSLIGEMDPYAVLGLSAGFTFHQLSDAYRARALQAAQTEQAASLRGCVSLQSVAAAFEVLSRTTSGAAGTRASLARRAGPEKTPRPRPPQWRPLARLKAALQGLERPQRQRTLEELPEALRLELLRYMELTAPKSSKHALGPGGPCGAGRCGLQRNRQGLFRAKMNLEHISLYSIFTQQDAAVEHHIFLVQLRRLVQLQLHERELDLSEAFGWAFQQMSYEAASPGRAEGFDRFLLRRGIRSYLTIHVARWLGSTHVTSPVLPLMEVLDLRKRLLLARDRGWEHFRSEWIAMMQRCGLSRRKRLQEPAQMVDVAHHRACAKKVKVGSKRRLLRAQLPSPELQLQRTLRAVRSAEVALARTARCAARSAHGAKKPRKEMSLSAAEIRVSSP